MCWFVLRLAVVLVAFLALGGAHLALGSASAEASPAAPGVVKEFEQPDGATIQLRLWGDEFVHGWETLDGYSVGKNPSSGYWEHLVRDNSGNLVPSGTVVGAGSPPAPAHLRPSDAAIDEARAARGAPPLGVPPAPAPPAWAGPDTDVLFIMVRFTDVPCTFTAAQMQTNLFGGGASGPGDLDSYFSEISYGALQLDGTVVGCFSLSNTRAYYDNGPATRPISLVNEAVALADSTVNFANFDNDGNTVVDALGIIYAGGGPHDGCFTDAPPDNLWPHRWNTGGTATGDGVTVNPYIMQSEITFAMADFICDERQTIGLFAHEFGHALGLPDLYDTDLSSEGIGSWSTMSSQYLSTVNLADTPPHFDPWSKWFEGWITPVGYTGVNADVPIPQVETNPSVVRLLANPGGPDDWAPPGSGQYFLIENRRQVNFDSRLPGCGLLIWHIDESQSTNRNEGHTASSHRLVDLEEADGLDELDSIGDRGDPGDPYRGSSGNTTFDNVSYPHSKLYTDAASGVSISDISPDCPATMTADLSSPSGPAVGGIAEFPDTAGASPEEAGAQGDGSGWSGSGYAALAGGLAAAASAIATGAWYARRRWLRRG